MTKIKIIIIINFKESKSILTDQHISIRELKLPKCELPTLATLPNQKLLKFSHFTVRQKMLVVEKW